MVNYVNVFGKSLRYPDNLFISLRYDQELAAAKNLGLRLAGKFDYSGAWAASDGSEWYNGSSTVWEDQKGNFFTFDVKGLEIADPITIDERGFRIARYYGYFLKPYENKEITCNPTGNPRYRQSAMKNA